MRINEGIINISVRELIEFVLRQGSINTSFVSSSRAVQGTIAHKKVQKSMDANYEPEVRLIHEHRDEELLFIVEGRADGVIRDLVSVTIDEIKSTTASLDKIDEDYNHLHWAQAKCYAYIYAHQNSLKNIRVRLTYYNLETKKMKHLLKDQTYEELRAFFEDLMARYAVWIRYYMAWIKVRNESLKNYTFPFGNYRPGQREMAVSIYKSIVDHNNLYVSAPTGIGKTISTLFPAVKAMGEGHVSKIFYLTAKTITRTVAEDTVRMIHGEETRVKSITITAKDKICFLEKRNCMAEHCEYANGHFDRIDEALLDALHNCDIFTRNKISEYAEKHKVCPFELTLDLAIYTDIVICDYNYVFDPAVSLKRFLDNREFVILVDEAHNLVDRAREMFSASLSKRTLGQVKGSLGGVYPNIGKALTKLSHYMLDIEKDYIEVSSVLITKDAPKELCRLLRNFVGECDKRLQAGAAGSMPNDLMDLYFEAYNFMKIFDLFDDKYVTYADEVDGDTVLKMFCIDPSFLIGETIAACKSVIFFSATLLPIDYYKYMLGGQDDKAIALSSPFDNKKSFRLIARDVSTRYQHREGSYEKICNYIEQVVGCKTGNYLVFFPSYKYMIEVYERFSKRQTTYTAYRQESNMTEEERESFLGRFVQEPTETIIGFCVLGGMFSEGIDLTKDRLIGVIVVGVGLPQIGLEKDLIKYYFNDRDKEGYHYAYTYPGMNKVLQAVGRLIRTEEDEGIVLLIDDRFTTPLYTNLLPSEFWPYHTVKFNQAQNLIDAFWENEKKQ